MKLHLLILIMVFSVQGQPVTAQRAEKPRPKAQLKLVAGHVPGERAAMLVKQHGIDFVADEEYLETLRLAGGEETLVAALREASAAVTAPPGQVRENPKEGLKYVWIPPGTFMMGCSPGDNECLAQETPSHQVTITKGFWMGQTEVTVDAYKRFAEATGRSMPPEPTFRERALNPEWGAGAMPIVNVTWFEAQAYCSWAGGRLPTEAEWEYAARGGSTASRYADLDTVAWYADNSGRERLDSTTISIRAPRTLGQRLKENANGMHNVGQKQANGFGLFDVLGNVWEWVSDWFDENYYQHSPSQDPTGPTSGQYRVLRGGSWYFYPRNVRSSNRGRVNPARGSVDDGFRCAGEVVNP
jgi:formylglycine-generating enzyme required for sulfatase activity